ncbi:hypothetical protein VPH35_059878 [Triticum aestivum]
MDGVDLTTRYHLQGREGQGKKENERTSGGVSVTDRGKRRSSSAPLTTTILPAQFLPPRTATLPQPGKKANQIPHLCFPLSPPLFPSPPRLPIVSPSLLAYQSVCLTRGREGGLLRLSRSFLVSPIRGCLAFKLAADSKIADRRAFLPFQY